MSSRPTKVLIIINDLLRGGAQRIVVDIAKGIDHSRYELVVVYCKPDNNFAERAALSLTEELRGTGVKVICAEGGKKFSWREFVTLWRIFKEEKPDIIQTFMPYAAVLGRIIGRLQGIRHVISVQCNLPVAYDWRTYWLDRLTLPLTEAWTAAAEGIGISYGGAVNYFSRQAWDKGLRHFTVVAGVDTDLIEKTGQELDRKKKRASLGIPEGVRLILMVARFVAWKGHSDLIAAMPFLPKDVHLLMAGWGSLQDDFEKQAFELGVADRIHFIGSRNDTYELLAISEVSIQPYSRQPNGRVWMGPNTSQMEAAAAGVPMVSTRVPLIEYLVEDGVSGKLAELNNPEDLARAINWLLDHPDEARRMADEAKKRIRERYSLKAMNGFYMGLYDALMSSS